MLWLKRNLFLALGGLVALILLAVGGVYLFGAFSRNNAVDEMITAKKTELNNQYNSPVTPSQANITLAKQQKVALTQFSAKAASFFTPVTYEKKEKAKELKQLLDTPLYDRRRQAEQAGVG